MKTVHQVSPASTEHLGIADLTATVDSRGSAVSTVRVVYLVTLAYQDTPVHQVDQDTPVHQDTLVYLVIQVDQASRVDQVSQDNQVREVQG